MELSVDYQCPACRRIIPREVKCLSPREVRACSECGTETELTLEGLAGLRRRVEELFHC
jgi:hypothetical protein